MAFVLSCRSPCAALAGSRAQAVPPSTALVHRTYSTSSCRGFARTSGQPSGAGFSQGQHARQVQCAVAQPPSSPLMSSESAPVLVEEIMVPHPTIFNSNMTCKEAARIMIQKDVSGAPVVDDNGKLIGILSESDLIWKGAGTPLDHTIIPPVFIGAFDLLVMLRDNQKIDEELHKILARTVGEAMTKEVISIGPGATMSDAAQLMLAKKVNRLPVVDPANGKVVGVLTRHDILRGMVSSKAPFLQ